MLRYSAVGHALVAAWCIACLGCGDEADPIEAFDQHTAATGQDVVVDGGAIDGGACLVDGALCDDQDPCTILDRCTGGVCAAGPNICDCRADDDCPAGDRCLGTPTCDTSKLPYRCGRIVGSAVDCGLDAFGSCTRARCDPTTGACSLISRPDGAGCLGSACAAKSTCEGGKCIDGVSFCACESDADCPATGDLCTGQRYCDKAAFPHLCRVNPTTVVSCVDSKLPCAPNACDPKTGQCESTPIELTNEVCVEGAAVCWRRSRLQRRMAEATRPRLSAAMMARAARRTRPAATGYAAAGTTSVRAPPQTSARPRMTATTAMARCTATSRAAPVS